MEQSGHICVGHIEIDKYANKSYEAMHNPKEDEFFANDIRDVRPDDLPECECYCFGFPCQTFSVAGKRGGFEDTRGTLFFEVMRLAAVRKPKYLFAENVTGLLSHDGGKTFGTILKALGELGYWYEYQVLNSKDFGVPQNRERVFIIGHLGGFGERKVFPIGQDDGKTPDIQGQQNNQPRGVVNCLTARYEGAQATGTYIIEREQHAQVKQIVGGMQGMRVYGVEGGLSVTLSSQGGGCGAKTGLYMVQAVNDPTRPNKTQNGRRIKDDGEPMFTLTAQDRHGVAISIDLKSEKSSTRRGMFKEEYVGALDSNCNIGVAKETRIRRLTPRECFRLQGYPNEYFERAAAVNSDSQLYKQAGNSVTVHPIRVMGERLADIERYTNEL